MKQLLEEPCTNPGRGRAEALMGISQASSRQEGTISRSPQVQKRGGGHVVQLDAERSGPGGTELVPRAQEGLQGLAAAGMGL